jgi:hypothetical protein
MILKAKTFLFYRVSAIAVVTGTGRDGTPTARFDVVERRENEIFRAPPDVARVLLAENSAEDARLVGPLAAACAGLRVRGVRTWHAIIGGSGYWQPAAAFIGRSHGGFEAHFRSEAEIAARWAAGEAGPPLFSFMTEHGFRRAFVWRYAGLREIATEVASFKRS